MKITTIATVVLLPLLSHADVLVKSTSVAVEYNLALAAISKATDDPNTRPHTQYRASQGLEKSIFGGYLSQLQYEQLINALKGNPDERKVASDQVVVGDVTTLILDHPTGFRIGKEFSGTRMMYLKFIEKPKFSVSEDPGIDTQEPTTGNGVQVTLGFATKNRWLFMNANWSWFHYRNPQGNEYLVLVSLSDKLEQSGAGQPATRPESKSEGGDKPQPEAGGRSR
jgi:hypothetical protein